MQTDLLSRDELPSGPGSRILRAADAEAWRHGFRFCSAARRRAQNIEEAAQQAYEAERARGYADGREQGASEATRLIAETSIAVDRYLASLEGEVAQIAMAIVRRVLGELDAADLVSRLAMGAIADLKREKWLKIKVHPANAERVRAAIGQSGSDPGFVASVEADPKLTVEDCVVASEFAVIDAGIETQLAAIAVALGVKQGGAAA